MTWSYTDPSASDKDAVRFAIGDTNTADQQLSDEEILWTLTQRTTVIGAALLCCDALIARYARLVTQSVGSVSVSYSDRLGNYRDLKDQLKICGPAALPFAGGTKVSEKETADEDEDRDPPMFSRDMFNRTDA